MLEEPGMNKSHWTITLALILWCISATLVQADLIITEVMSRSSHASPTDCDWWELTNTGPVSLNLSGYSWDDDHQRVGENVFSKLTIDANESIIIRETVDSPEDVWRLDWYLGPELNVCFNSVNCGYPMNHTQMNDPCLISSLLPLHSVVVQAGCLTRVLSASASGLVLCVA
jgi:hypothetical protein